MGKRAWWAAIVVSMAAVALPASAADTGLDAIPGDVGVVLRVKSPKATIEKIAAFANGIDPMFGRQAQQMSGAIGLVISNPTLAGVDQSADWFVAVFPKVDGEPGVAFVVPATDASAMAEAVKGRFEFTKFEKWGVYSEDAATAATMKKFASAPGKTIGAKMDAESKTLFAASDVGIYVNAAQLKTVYKDQFEALGPELDRLLQQIPENSPEVPGLDLKPIMEMYGKMAKGLLRGVQDTDGFTFAVKFEPKSLVIEEYVRVDAGTPTADFLKGNAPAAIDLLGKLPTGQLGYFGMHGNAQGLMTWSLELMTSMLKGNDAARKNLETQMTEYSKLKLGSIAASFGLGSLESGALRSVTAMEVTPGDKARAISREMVKAMGGLEIGGTKQQIDVQTAAEKYGSDEADVVTIKQEISPELDPLGIQKQIMSALYGPDGAVTRVVYRNDRTIQTAGGGKAAMEAALKALDGPAPTGPDAAAFQATRSQLAPKANFVLIFDLPGTLQQVAKLVVESGQLPIPITPEAINKLGLQRTYLGFSAAMDPTGLRLKTYVPSEQVQGMVKLVQMGMQLMQQKPDL